MPCDARGTDRLERRLGSRSLLAQLDKSPVAAALTTAGGIATWCSNRKRPFPDTGDMGAYMCVDHPTSNSRAPVATATTTASIRRRELDSPALPATYCSSGGNNYVPSRRDRAQQKRKILISTTGHFLEGPPNFPFGRPFPGNSREKIPGRAVDSRDGLGQYQTTGEAPVVYSDEDSKPLAENEDKHHKV